MHENGFKLDIGCGKNKVKEAIGVDINKNSDADVICDVEKGLPFKDSTFDEIHCNQIIEHINNLVELMEEIYRVGKSKAKIFVNSPYYASFNAFSDPTHKRYITEHTFDMFTRNYRSTNAIFKIKKVSFQYSKIAKILFFIPKYIIRRFIFNSTLGIHFELEVNKE